jgi:hypothetical protein
LLNKSSNVDGQIQSQFLNNDQRVTQNFRQFIPRSNLPDNWDRNPFLFQTYKY